MVEEIQRKGRTSEGVDGDEHSADVSVDFAVLPPFLEVLVDALVRDRGKESHIGHADLLLLESFLPVCLKKWWFRYQKGDTTLRTLEPTFTNLFAPFEVAAFLAGAAADFFPACLDMAYR